MKHALFCTLLITAVGLSWAQSGRPLFRELSSGEAELKNSTAVSRLKANKSVKMLKVVAVDADALSADDITIMIDDQHSATFKRRLPGTSSTDAAEWTGAAGRNESLNIIKHRGRINASIIIGSKMYSLFPADGDTYALIERDTKAKKEDPME